MSILGSFYVYIGQRMFLLLTVLWTYIYASNTGIQKCLCGKIKDGFDSISKRMEEQMKIVFASSCTRCMFLSICYGGCRLERTTGEHDNGYSKNDLTYI